VKRKDGESPANMPGFDPETPEETETLIYETGGQRSDPAFAGGEGVRFDYSAFEQTMDQFRATGPEITAPAQRPPPSADQVQKRRTIDEQSIPKDDAVYEIRQLGSYHIVTVRGQLNESFPGRNIGNQLHGPTLFDLTEVDRVTSFGVRAWLEMLETARLPFAAFVRASPAIVNQITMMRNFCGMARIHSLVAPYACPRCGSGFGVPFEALEDRTILRSRNPPKVVCPECRGPAEMDEDPWIYFDIDDHLLDNIDHELQQVLVHMGDGPKRPPVEKSIVGEVTRVRINGAVSGSNRLQRAFGGLEGKCVLDLRAVSELDYAGIDNLLQRLQHLPEEVTRLSIEGAPLPLVQRLMDERAAFAPGRVVVNSVVTTVRSLSRPLRRRLCVDLKRNRVALRERRVPELDLPWRDDPMELEGQDLLAQALMLLPDDGNTSASLSSMPSVPRMPSYASQVMPVAVQPSPLRPARPKIPWLALLSVASVMFAAVFLVTLAITLLFQNRDVLEPQTGAEIRIPGAPTVLTSAIGAAAITVPSEGWSTGGALPPAWSELDLAESNGTILVVGRGESALAEQALAAAREQASDRLMLVLAREMRLPFADEELPAEGPEREAALANWRGASAPLMLTRVQDAAHRNERGYEVVAQYSVSRDELDAFALKYTQQVAFRGLTVAPSSPWSTPGLRLVRRESYIRSVEPGDRLKSIGGTAVATLEDFQVVAESAYLALEEGGTLPFVFDRGGQSVITTIYKPKTQKEPVQTQGNRPTLFRKD
jgi:ABC-type transporter Mla MlaB component